VANRNLDFFAEVTEQWRDHIVREAVDGLHEVAEDAEEGVRERINTAVTPWGSARQAGLVSGPQGSPNPREHAGRRETDAMFESVESSVEPKGDMVWEARWGWPDPELYILVQEHGFEKYDTRIVPMEALAITLDQAEVEYAERLRNAIRGAS
jgi:hypothetical protein